jgi:hypothetical protein
MFTFLLAGDYLSTNQSQSHIMVDGQSISYYFLTVTVLFIWGALSDERTGMSFVYAVGPHHSVVFLGSESLGTRYHILLSQI